jgi:FkbM family methyltransferase
MAAVLLHCGAKVICIEPQPRCVEILKKRFFERTDVVIVQKGVASKEGVLPLAVCSNDIPLASFSQEWKKLHTQQLWDQEINVPMTTLDKLIKQYGKPSFCKIDVEGFEYEVFRGLTVSVPYFSFEFHGAVLTDTEKCIAYLHQLGNAAFNYSLYSNHRLVLSSWTSGKEILQQLKKIHDPKLCGDIYVRF